MGKAGGDVGYLWMVAFLSGFAIGLSGGFPLSGADERALGVFSDCGGTARMLKQGANEQTGQNATRCTAAMLSALVSAFGGALQKPGFSTF